MTSVPLWNRDARKSATCMPHWRRTAETSLILPYLPVQYPATSPTAYSRTPAPNWRSSWRCWDAEWPRWWLGTPTSSQHQVRGAWSSAYPIALSNHECSPIRTSQSLILIWFSVNQTVTQPRVASGLVISVFVSQLMNPTALGNQAVKVWSAFCLGNNLKFVLRYNTI